MDDSPFDTNSLRNILDRMKSVEPDVAANARDELIRRACVQLENHARRMLRGHAIARWEQTGDVLQEALIRLMRALKEVDPPNTRAFFGLAILQIRRQLLDLCDRYFGPQGLGANHASNSGSTSAINDPSDKNNDPSRRAVWYDLMELIDRLPKEQRDVVELRFVYGFTEEEAAEIMGIARRTVQKYWSEARVALGSQLAKADQS